MVTIQLCVCVCSVAKSCPTLQTHRQEPTRFLCPWDHSGKNTRMGCHFLLQGIFLTKGSNPHLLCLLHWQVGSLTLGGLTIHWIILNLFGSCFYRHLSPSIISLLFNHNSFSISQKTEQQFCEQRRQNWLIGEIFWEYHELTNKESLKHLSGSVKKENQQIVPFRLMWDRSVGEIKKRFLRDIFIFLLPAAIRCQSGTPILHVFPYVFISSQHSCLKLESCER